MGDVIEMDRQATKDDIEQAARKMGYAIASPLLPHVEARKGRFSEVDIEIVEDAIKSGLNKAFGEVLAEQEFTPDELDLWSRSMSAGAKAAIAHCFAPYLKS